MPRGDAPGRRDELVRVFRVDAAFDRVPAHADLALREGQFLARGHADLHLHDVDAADQLGDGVLDLHARVHLDEVELTVFVEELKGARTAVADLLAGGRTAIAHLFDQAPGDAGRRRFFDDFLVAPLHGAIALTQVNSILMLVGQNLDFNVAWILEEFLHINRWIAKRSTGLCLGHGNGIDECRFGVYNTHAASTAPAGCLDDDRIPYRLGNTADQRRVIWQLAFRSGHTRHTRANHGLLGRYLVAHDTNGLGSRANELEAALFYAFGEVSVFGQKPVSGVNGFGIGHFCRRDNGGNIQVAQRRRGRSNTNRLIGQFDVLGIAVGFRINHHRLDAQLAAGALDSQRNLAAIGDQDFFKHRISQLQIRVDHIQRVHRFQPEFP